MTTAPPTENAGAHAPSSRTWLAPTLVVAAACAVYARVLDYDWVWLDDHPLILERQAWLARLSSLFAAFAQPYLEASYYRPLVTASYVLDAQWSAAKPFGFHFTNVALHDIASLLVFRLVRRLRAGDGPAMLGALCFAVHPALVAAVAWVPGRNDTLLTVFALGAWLALLRDADAPRWRAKVAHVLLFAAALFTKETATVLPVLYAGHIWIRSGRAGLFRARWAWASWGAALAVYLVARQIVLVGPPGQAADRLQAFVHQIPLLMQNLGKLLVPVSLAPVPVARDTATWPSLVALGALGAAAALLPPSRRRLGAAVAVMVVPLLPGLVVSETLMLENRLYLPAVGVAMLVAELVRAYEARSGESRRPALPLRAAVLLALVVLTLRHQRAFADRPTFTRASVAASPHSALAHLNQGVWYQEREHDLAKAAEAYRRGIENDPSYPMLHNNLGVLLMDQQRWAEAERELRAELAAHPSTAIAHFNLGLVLSQQGRQAEAEAAWRTTVQLRPTHVDALGHLLVAALKRGDAEQATAYQRLLEAQGATMLPGAPAGPR